MGKCEVLGLCVSLLLAAGGTGCLPKYSGATVNYAEASLAAVGSLSSMPALASELCWKRARIDRTNQRMISKDAGFGSKPSWSKWMTAPGKADGTDWKRHCEGIAATQPAAGGALAVLATYSTAIKGLAEGGSYTGSDLRGIAEQAAQIATTAEAPAAARALAPLGEPLTQLTHLLFKAYAAGQLKAFVEAGNPTVQGVVKALQDYLEAIESQLALLEQKQGQVLDKLETQLASASSNDPARTIVFLDYAEDRERELAQTHTVLSGYRQTLINIANRHDALARELAGKVASPQGAPR